VDDCGQIGAANSKPIIAFVRTKVSHFYCLSTPCDKLKYSLVLRIKLSETIRKSKLAILYQYNSRNVLEESSSVTKVKDVYGVLSKMVVEAVRSITLKRETISKNLCKLCRFLKQHLQINESCFCLTFIYVWLFVYRYLSQ